jgi:lysozyme
LKFVTLNKRARWLKGGPALRRFGQFVAVPLLFLSGAYGEAFGQRVPIDDDVSRAELLEYATKLDGGTRAILKEFVFPRDADDQVFGVDVSHFQGEIDWAKLAAQGVIFAYIKATQGRYSYDRMFDANWTALEALGSAGTRPYRGAYHFMSAGAEAAEQAKNFLEEVKSLNLDDLPPCLDLEWDFERTNGAFVVDKDGKPIDRWSAHSTEQIIERALIWLEAVETATGRKPIIYTNAQWWKERIGSSDKLSGYTLWMADYSAFAINRKGPRHPAKHEWKLWQLTETGKVSDDALSGPVDVNVFQGSMADFEAWCCKPIPVAAEASVQSN